MVKIDIVIRRLEFQDSCYTPMSHKVLLLTACRLEMVNAIAAGAVRMRRARGFVGLSFMGIWAGWILQTR